MNQTKDHELRMKFVCDILKNIFNETIFQFDIFLV